MDREADYPQSAVVNTVTDAVFGNVVQAGSIEGGIHNYQTARRAAIEPFAAPSPPDAGWLMEQPSRLLVARSQVVPFIGRETELRQLRQWRDAPDRRLSVLLLHAPGGQGKTRLATEFAERSRSPQLPQAKRWQVLQAGFRSAPVGSAPLDSETPPPHGEAGVLLVVDYADRWAHSELQDLLSQAVLSQEKPTRVLLIGRTVRWFSALRSELNDRRADATDLLLPPLVADRLRMFTAARDRFGEADLYDLPDIADIQPPDSLGHGDFGLALNLHMAALVTVDAHKRGVEPSLTEPHHLSAYLLDRERLAWQRLVDAGRYGQDYRTGPTVMAKTVFTAILTGPVSHATGKRALTAVDLPVHVEQLLDDHRFCYPPADRALVLEPLYPDRLAEDFLGLLIPGHDISSYEPDPWASDAPASLAGEQDLRPIIAPRAVTFLASAASRWAHVGKEVLYPLLRRDPDLAIAGGSAALAALAALGDTSGPDDAVDADLLAVLEVVESRLPRGRDVNLDIGILAVVELMIAHRLATTTDPGERAFLYGTLAWRRANAGRREDAVAPAEEAVRLRRQLAAGDPDDPDHLRCLSRLATAVANLGDRLSDVGRPEEALFLAEEAVAISRRLVTSAPST